MPCAPFLYLGQKAYGRNAKYNPEFFFVCFPQWLHSLKSGGAPLAAAATAGAGAAAAAGGGIPDCLTQRQSGW